MKRFFTPKSLAVTFLLVCVGAGGYYIYRGAGGPLLAINTGDIAQSTGDSTTTPPALSQSTPVTQDAGAGQRLYKNTSFHFSLVFPDNLVATEYKEQGGALTASFQDPSTNEGFEVYVTPYGSKQIDTARFKLDEPSGTFLQPTDVVVDGTRATMFFGKNGIMGDTREVWFIRGGYLYEVTTYKELDTWLGGIMQSWKFI